MFLPESLLTMDAILARFLHTAIRREEMGSCLLHRIKSFFARQNSICSDLFVNQMTVVFFICLKHIFIILSYFHILIQFYDICISLYFQHILDSNISDSSIKEACLFFPLSFSVHLKFRYDTLLILKFPKHNFPRIGHFYQKIYVEQYNDQIQLTLRIMSDRCRIGVSKLFLRHRYYQFNRELLSHYFRVKEKFKITNTCIP